MTQIGAAIVGTGWCGANPRRNLCGESRESNTGAASRGNARRSVWHN